MALILSQLTNHLIKNSEVQEKTKDELIQFYKDRETNQQITTSPRVKRKEPLADSIEAAPQRAYYGKK